MKKIFIFLFICLFFIQGVFAAVPYLDKCFQQGFERNKTHCFLPDGSFCTLESFEDGRCGGKYQEFCIKQGELVWNGEGYPCCSGMVPYLRPGNIGQTSCQYLPPLYKRFLDNLKYSLFFWIIGLALFFFILLISIVTLLTKNPKREMPK